jgi:hypothetical protein
LHAAEHQPGEIDDEVVGAPVENVVEGGVQDGDAFRIHLACHPQYDDVTGWGRQGRRRALTPTRPGRGVAPGLVEALVGSGAGLGCYRH